MDVKALGGRGTGKYDESNALVLPSKKRKTVVHSADKNSGQKLLSKKQRKKLEKIVERREKKSNRAELLEELQKHQLPAEEYAQLTPLLQIQTEGLKKLFSNIEKGDFETGNINHENDKLGKQKSKTKGSNRLKYRSWSGRFGQNVKSKEDTSKDPMVLGFDEDSSSTENDSSDEDEMDIAAATIPAEQVEDLEENSILDNRNDDAEEEDCAASSEKVLASTSESKDADVKPDLEVLKVCINTMKKPKQFVQVIRTPEIEAVRSKLPIIPEEHIIMESITENLVTILAGETGMHILINCYVVIFRSALLNFLCSLAAFYYYRIR